MSSIPSRKVIHQAQALEGTVLRPTTRPAPWVAVSGGKGGVGKTLLAVNLALLIARAGYRTLLVDLDPGLANVDIHLRLAPGFTVEDLASGLCTTEAAILEGPGGLSVLAGRSGSAKLASGDQEFLTATLDAVTRAAHGFDVVICDTGAGIGPAVLATAERASLVLAVTTPEPSALTDTYSMCKVLHRAGRPLPSLVVNRARSREDAMQTARRLSSVCKRFLGHGTTLVGWLHSNSMLELSILDQRPFSLHGSGPALEDLRAITASILSALPAGTRPRARKRKPPPQRFKHS